jgi:LysM domain
MPAPHHPGDGAEPARWPLVAWAAALVLALWVLVDLGSGALGVPVTSLDALVTWVDQSSPDTMALALLRLAALAGASYLAACTLLLLAVAMVHRPGIASGALRLTPAIVRRLVFGGGGLGLAAGTLLAVSPSPVAAAPVVSVTASVPGDDDPVSATTATMTRIDTPSGDDATGAVVARADDTRSTAATATMTRIRPAAGGVAALPAAPAPAPRATAAADDVAGRWTWVVEPGDSFWSIAADTLSGPGSRQPTDREVDGYWRHLVLANRDRLVDSDNPDLLVPGQELVIPDPG